MSSRLVRGRVGMSVIIAGGAVERTKVTSFFTWNSIYFEIISFAVDFGFLPTLVIDSLTTSCKIRF